MARPFLAESQINAQRSRLALAALTLYRAQGYEAVTLRNVAAQLDISHATPYRYFRSKEDLIAAVRSEVWSRFAEHLEREDRPAETPIARLRDICLSVVEFAVRYPAEYRLIFSLRQPPANDYPPLEEARARAASFVVSACQRAIDAGQLQGDALTWAHVAWAAIHGLLSLHVGNQLVLGRELDKLVGPILQTLLPNAPKTDWKAFSKRLAAIETSTPRE